MTPADHTNETARLRRAREAMRPPPGDRGLLQLVLQSRGIGDWETAPRPVRDAAFSCRLCLDRETAAGFYLLVTYAEAHAGRLLNRRTPDGMRTYALPLLRLAAELPNWTRWPQEWRPRGKDASRQFEHLARTLLGRERAGEFLADVFSGRLGYGMLARLRAGRNVREQDQLPVYLTARMEWHFAEAAANYDLVRALRWGQLRGLGGSVPLAQALLHTRLGCQLWEPAEERWWLDFLIWCANQPDLDPAELALLMEFAAYRRYGDEAEGREPDPEFRMKGRRVRPLFELAVAWAEEAGRQPRKSSFRRCGVSGGRWERETGAGREEWSIQEILEVEVLREEGRRQHHCVAWYAWQIRAGRCSIWAMRVRRSGVPRRAVTIELALPERRIVQVRGRNNRAPTEKEWEILRLWAEEQGLEY